MGCNEVMGCTHKCCDYRSCRVYKKVEMNKKSIHELRIAAVFSCVVFLAYSIIDLFFYPDLFNTFLRIRILVAIGHVLILLITLLKNADRYSSLLKMLTYFLCSAAIIVMVHLTGGYTSPYYAGLNIILISFAMIMPLETIYSIITCAVIYAGYVLPILLFQDIGYMGIFLNNNLFIFTTMILAIASTILLNRQRSKDFSTRYNLAKANEKLRNIDTIKTQFFANVSHEVRTPLASIIAPLQSLRQGDVGETTPDQDSLLNQMHRNSIKLLDLINQILDFSKIEAKKEKLRLTQVNLAEYTRDIVALFRDIATNKGVDLLYEADSESSKPIYIDPYRYDRIIINLIKNALKFTEKGEISVELKNDDDDMVITVADSGPGISKANLPHIFERFVQIRGSSAQTYEGTGLGLAIVKASVELLHGSISVDSVMKIGTVFTAKIPTNLLELDSAALMERRSINTLGDTEFMANANSITTHRRQSDFAHIPVSHLAWVESPVEFVEEKTETSETETHSKHHILIVEDTDDLRNYISRILTVFGYHVVAKKNGLEGWEYLREGNKVNLIVTDIMMPKLDGYELLKKIRFDEKYKDLPVILISAKAGDDPKLKALGIGADDYLPKPINIRELDARIKNLLTIRELVKVEADAAVMEQRIDELILSFAQTLELRDAETGDHCQNVLDLGTSIAQEMHVTIDRTLKAALLLHDIGKIGMPDSILLKPSELDEKEMAIMKQHPEIGHELLGHFPSLKAVAEMTLSHQEYWDGNGYPRGIKGEEIPLYARIISVADAFHAMMSDRRYSAAISEEAAIEELRRNRGTQFDPEVVDAFIQARKREPSNEQVKTHKVSA